LKAITKFALVATAMATISAVAQAQLTSTATVTISATVSASLAASNGGNLAFGTVIQGGAATTILPSAGTAGKVSIVGANNAGITITATTLPATLTNGANTLGVSAYNYCYSQNNSNGTCGSGTSIASGGSAAAANLSGTGNGYFWLGATLAAPSAAQVVGAYSGTVTITVTNP
jgi:hypothetical protein